MSLPNSSNIRIQDLIKSLENGEYRVPRFQRDYVWDVKKAANLVDSILRGYPIGSVILWRTKNNLSEIKDLGGFTIPTKDEGKYTSYIIDGQQRLTSLFVALKGLKAKNGTDCSNLYLDLTSDGSSPIVVNGIPKGADSNNYVLLKSLFDATGLIGTHNEKRLEYYQILLQYSVSIIQVDDESLGLEEVVDIFERLNLGGKRLSLFSIIAARTYVEKTQDNEGFDLQTKYDKLNEELGKSYGRITESTMLQTLAACLISKCNKTEILKSLSEEDVVKNYNEVEKALRKAIVHLQGSDYGVKIASLLPYDCILVPFTYFYYKNGNNVISAKQHSYLIDFFWRSVLGARYGSQIDTKLNFDLIKFNQILGEQLPSQEKIALSPNLVIENGRFLLGSAFIKGLLCLMASNNPKSFTPGREIVIGKEALSNTAEKQYHHFFPKKSQVVINNNEYKENVNNVVNIVFMDALTNQQIDNQNPSQYIEYYESLHEDFDGVLKTHFISKSDGGILSDDYNLFLKKRSINLFTEVMRRMINTESTIITETK